MSDTIVDMAKVAQMFDARWEVTIFKNELGSYTVRAYHGSRKVRERTAEKLVAFFNANAAPGLSYIREADWEGDSVETEDFTPEQALTRMAYKVHGEILGVKAKEIKQ